MGKIRFSESAIKASFLVRNPDWYQYEISKIITKAATSGSTNYIFIFTGLNGEMQDVGVSVLINEKADWIMYPIFKAANGGQDLAPNTEVDPMDLLNVRLEAYTVRGQRQDGTPQNSLVEFRPLPKAA